MAGTKVCSAALLGRGPLGTGGLQGSGRNHKYKGVKEILYVVFFILIGEEI